MNDRARLQLLHFHARFFKNPQRHLACDVRTSMCVEMTRGLWKPKTHLFMQNTRNHSHIFSQLGAAVSSSFQPNTTGLLNTSIKSSLGVFFSSNWRWLDARAPARSRALCGLRSGRSRCLSCSGKNTTGRWGTREAWSYWSR